MGIRRTKMTEAKAIALHKEWAAGDWLTMAAFLRSKGLAKHSLSAWRSNWGIAGTNKMPPGVNGKPVNMKRLEVKDTGAPLEIRTKDGHSILVHDLSMLKGVLDARR